MNFKQCSCGYEGDDFGKDSSQIDAISRYCRPCVRAKSAVSARAHQTMVKAWHADPCFLPGTVPTDEWRVANGFRPAGQRGPRPLSEMQQREMSSLLASSGRKVSPAEWAEMRRSVLGESEPLSDEDRAIAHSLADMFTAPSTPPPPE